MTLTPGTTNAPTTPHGPPHAPHAATPLTHAPLSKRGGVWGTGPETTKQDPSDDQELPEVDDLLERLPTRQELLDRAGTEEGRP